MTLGLVYGGVSSAAGLAQGLLTGAGSWRTNYENRQLVRQQMSFQERMSNTAYQRAVGDARSAGLNPALLYQQGGASSPAGASAHMENALGAGVSAYQQAKMQAQEMRESQSRADLNREQRLTQLDQQDFLRSQKANMDLDTEIRRYDLPSARAIARTYEGRVGQVLSFADRLKSLVPLQPLRLQSNSARSLRR